MSGIQKRVVAAIARIRENDQRVSFYSVAQIAHVSRSTLYRNANLRELVESARDGLESAVEPSRLDLLEARIAQLESDIAHLRATDKVEGVGNSPCDSSVGYWLMDLGCAA